MLHGCKALHLKCIQAVKQSFVMLFKYYSYRLITAIKIKNAINDKNVSSGSTAEIHNQVTKSDRSTDN